MRQQHAEHEARELCFARMCYTGVNQLNIVEPLVPSSLQESSSGSPTGADNTCAGSQFPFLGELGIVHDSAIDRVHTGFRLLRWHGLEASDGFNRLGGSFL